jgi:hypothetical protein
MRVAEGDVGLGLTADHYFIDEMLLREGGFKLDWFMGLGAYGNFVFADNSAIAAGARLPIGLSWHFARHFELWAAIAPSLGMKVTPDFEFPDFWFAGEIGFRAWLK